MMMTTAAVAATVMRKEVVVVVAVAGGGGDRLAPTVAARRDKVEKVARVARSRSVLAIATSWRPLPNATDSL